MDHEDLKEDLSAHLLENDVHLRLPGVATRTPSPSSSAKSLPSLRCVDGARGGRRRTPRSVDSAITSEGSSPSSLSISDISASSHSRSRKTSRGLMALDEFRPNNIVGADGDGNAVPDECFQVSSV